MGPLREFVYLYAQQGIATRWFHKISARQKWEGTKDWVYVDNTGDSTGEVLTVPPGLLFIINNKSQAISYFIFFGL